MVADASERIERYMLHDPIGNVEGVVAEYNIEKLKEAEKQGAVFIAVYDSGRRQLVKAEDITPPKPTINGVTLVQPKFVNDRMMAIVNVFDALIPDMLSSFSLDAKQEKLIEALSDLKEIVKRGDES